MIHVWAKALNWGICCSSRTSLLVFFLQRLIWDYSVHWYNLWLCRLGNSTAHEMSRPEAEVDKTLSVKSAVLNMICCNLDMEGESSWQNNFGLSCVGSLLSLNTHKKSIKNLMLILMPRSQKNKQLLLPSLGLYSWAFHCLLCHWITFLFHIKTE